MRRVVPSKKLLLQREISDDNAAYNGEVYGASGIRGRYPTVQWISNSLEDQNDAMIIPWEVDQVLPMQNSRISRASWTETEVSCSNLRSAQIRPRECVLWRRYVFIKTRAMMRHFRGFERDSSAVMFLKEMME